MRYLLAFFLLSGMLIQNVSADSEGPAKTEPRYVGSFFDIQVPEENYYFIKGVLAVFGNRFGPQPKTPKEEEGAVWDQLLLSYEAFRRGAAVSQEEVDTEIVKVLQADKVEFDWKKDKEAYEKWLKDKTGEPPKLFENQIRHLLQIQRLREQVMAAMEPPVSNKEAFGEFLNEHNALNIELVEFDKKSAAVKFYNNVRSHSRSWDEEKEKRPGDFKRPGFVALDFLIDIWRFPRDDAYKMLRMKPNLIYRPFPIYKGYAVAKILEKRAANEQEFERFKTSYYEQIRARKKHEGLGKWFEDLKKQAKIKIYKKEG